MPQLGPLEILVVAVIALMVFGPKRLPEVGRQVGHGIRELRKIQETVRAEIHDVLNAPDSPSSTSSAHSSPDDAAALSPGALPTGYRTSGTPAVPAGRAAPSRFRPAVAGAPTDATDTSKGAPSPVEAGDADASPDASPDASRTDRVEPARGSGMRAPSRFRTPGA